MIDFQKDIEHIDDRLYKLELDVEDLIKRVEELERKISG